MVVFLRNLLVFILFLTLQTGYAFADSDNSSKEPESVGKITDVIENEFGNSGLDVKAEVRLNDKSKNWLFDFDSKIRNMENDNIKIADFNYNPKSLSFKVTLIFGFDEDSVKYLNVFGNYKEMIEIPVLRRNLARAAEITEADIVLKNIEKDQIRFDTITEESKLIGFAVKRNLREGTLFREADIQKSQIISRNSKVNVTYETQYLSLKTIGLALDNGGSGDLIRVRNLGSNKIITGIIKDSETVVAVNGAAAADNKINSKTSSGANINPSNNLNREKIAGLAKNVK